MGLLATSSFQTETGSTDTLITITFPLYCSAIFSSSGNAADTGTASPAPEIKKNITSSVIGEVVGFAFNIF